MRRGVSSNLVSSACIISVHSKGRSQFGEQCSHLFSLHVFLPFFSRDICGTVVNLRDVCHLIEEMSFYFLLPKLISPISRL
mmetsp:Transcript_39942/g.106793  ORF Transcript_39942/g.106793 Transcript_39942/m.106793 type:complete len:81 (+) Transcript_39942:508-750(+)